MFITGPDVIKTVTHEEVTKEALGGAETHSGQERRGPFHRQYGKRLLADDPRADQLSAQQ